MRTATGAPADSFLAETRIPRASPANPQQNWRAPDIETLWDSPLAGRTGTTVGQALAEMLDRDGQFVRQLDRLGQGLAHGHVLLSAPVVGERLRRTGAAAYHTGFVEPLAAHPKDAIFAVVHGSPRQNDPPSGPDADARSRSGR